MLNLYYILSQLLDLLCNNGVCQRRNASLRVIWTYVPSCNTESFALCSFYVSAPAGRGPYSSKSTKLSLRGSPDNSYHAMVSTYVHTLRECTLCVYGTPPVRLPSYHDAWHYRMSKDYQTNGRHARALQIRHCQTVIQD